MASSTDPLAAPQGAGQLPGLDAQPHARAVLAPALAGGSAPSHAYLFHGPAGTGKRELARAFAAELLAERVPDPAGARSRALRGTHPDLTWVSASGAAETLVSDVDEPVVAAATRTPFESTRRVFVIEAADTLNEQAANRLLKTLEEPPSYVHLLLLSDSREEVMETIASRCQHVRFDPLPEDAIVERLLAAGAPPAEDREGELVRLRACARLALGNARLAATLAGAEGAQLRAGAERYVRAALAGSSSERPWTTVIELAKAAGERALAQAEAGLAEDLELAPARDRKRIQREATELGRRAGRRASTAALVQALGLAELWLRDLLCLAEGAPELVHNLDRVSALEQDALICDGSRARAGIGLVQDTRLRVSVLNMAEELALEALAFRL